MKIKLIDIHITMFFIGLIFCVQVCCDASMLPLPASLIGSDFNAQGQMTGQAVRADLNNNIEVVDQQDQLLTQVRKSIESLKNNVSSLFTRAEKKIEQLEQLIERYKLPEAPIQEAAQQQQPVQEPVQVQQQPVQEQVQQPQQVYVQQQVQAHPGMPGALANGIGIGGGMVVGSMAVGAGSTIAQRLVQHPVDSFILFKLARWWSKDKGEKASYVAGKIRHLQDDMNKKAERLDRRKSEYLDLMNTLMPRMKKIDTKLAGMENRLGVSHPILIDAF